MKAGAETPATVVSMVTIRIDGHSLNEGRGRNPGDRPPARGEGERGLRRSMKAGAETPATGLWQA